jgi:hypothetical protein
LPIVSNRCISAGLAPGSAAVAWCGESTSAANAHQATNQILCVISSSLQYVDDIGIRALAQRRHAGSAADRDHGAAEPG